MTQEPRMARSPMSKRFRLDRSWTPQAVGTHWDCMSRGVWHSSYLQLACFSHINRFAIELHPYLVVTCRGAPTQNEIIGSETNFNLYLYL